RRRGGAAVGGDRVRGEAHREVRRGTGVLVEGRGAGDEPVVAGDRLVTRRRRRRDRRRVRPITIVSRRTEGDIATGREGDGVTGDRVVACAALFRSRRRGGAAVGGDRVRGEAQRQVRRGTGVLVERRGAGDQAVVAGDRLVTRGRR